LVSAGSGAAPGLPLNQAASLIEQIAAMGVDELLLTGGEPLARPDLPEIIAMLAANRIRWSLNTAFMPTFPQQAAIEKWPPVFAAVSLDGPPAVHDQFRGCSGSFARAMHSLQYFAGLIPQQVAAGTTVTTANFGSLPETFGLVLESRAASWGLHLLVPEGRAAQHPELQLSRRQLKQLLAFAAAKRNHFPVTMADEIGYCGYWEPLLRENPFYCGAGKLQCVILPDGEVVPCTTADRSESAGNLQTRNLRDIWETGFACLRQWTPSTRCARCAYSPACQGGCWLQRRHGTECYRDVWHLPQALTKAGIVVCLGLASATHGADTTTNPPPSPLASPLSPQGERKMEMLQSAIIQWYAATASGYRTPSPGGIENSNSIKQSLPADPGAAFFLQYIQGQTAREIVPLVQQLEAAQKTEQRSLCLIGLLWRSLAEWCLDGTHPTQRTPAQKAALRQALTSMSMTAEAWRKQIFEEKLDPFLRQPSDYRRFFLTKGGPPPQVRLAQQLAGKRGWTNPNITNTFLAEHPYAETMALELAGPEGLTVIRQGRPQPGAGKIGIFDLVVVPAHTTTNAATLKGGRQSLKVILPAGTELAYGDLLQLAYAQNQDELDQLAGSLARAGWQSPEPLLLPALRKIRQSLDARKILLPDQERARIEWLLADLYLF
jgi:radical SAM protein with 4Fe4S-binding SPASM domain